PQAGDVRRRPRALCAHELRVVEHRRHRLRVLHLWLQLGLPTALVEQLVGRALEGVFRPKDLVFKPSDGLWTGLRAHGVYGPQDQRLLEVPLIYRLGGVGLAAVGADELSLLQVVGEVARLVAEVDAEQRGVQAELRALRRDLKQDVAAPDA